MGFVWCRVLVKVISFAFLASFVFVFVVQGYRYDTIDQSLKQMNAYIQIQFWGDNHDITIKERSYKSHDTQLNVYHMQAGCYDITIDDRTRNFCIQENAALYLSYLTVKGSTYYNNKHLLCSSLEARTFDKNCINEICFSEDISNAFLYRNIHFVKTKNHLWYCAKDFKHCNFLYTTAKEILCGNIEGLVLQDGEILLLE